MARPTKYSKELGVKICSQIAEGKSLVSICKADEMPSTVTVYSWLNDEENKEFLNTYTRAREDQADTLADEIISIADEECTIIRGVGGGDNEDVEVVFDSVAVARNRLRVDARKWTAAKLRPKKYSDKMDIDHSGSFVTESVITFVKPSED